MFRLIRAFAKTVLILGLALFLLREAEERLPGPRNAPPRLSGEENPWEEDGGPAGPFDVVHVIDGDTIIVGFGSGRERKVRLIGIDAPESAAWDAERNCPEGERAAAFVRSLLDGAWVWLERDAETEDRYGRLLAYVRFSEDGGPGGMVNLRILEAGYAEPLTVPPNVRYARLFRDAHRAAVAAGAGLYAA